MKKIILFSALIVSLTFGASAQEKTAKYMGYIEAGAQKGMTSKANGVTGFRGAYNSVINEKYVIGLNYIYAFEKNFTKRANPNHLNNYSLPYINFGVRNKICKNFYITPSLGIGQGNYTLTDFTAEEVAVLSLSTISIETEKKYSRIKETELAFPINLNLLYTSKYFGLGLNLYLVTGKYTEMGAGLSINFGKVRN